MASKSRLFSKLLGSGTSGTIPQTSISSDVSFGVSTYNNISTLPLSGNDIGDQAFVDSDNRLYIWNGSGWYNIALINTSPSITGGYQAEYQFATDGTPIVITLVGSDPEGIPLTWSYEVTSGSLTNGGGTTATVSNVDNVFTITPSTNLDYSGAFSLTFKASDGINIATAISSFTLQFILLNSNHTTLLAKGTAATQNTTFIDSSTNNHTITANGDVYQGTFSPYRSGGYSLYLDGVDDNVTVPYNSTAFNMGTTTNFTMEAWINIPSYGKNILVVFPGTATGNWLWLVHESGYLSLYVYPSISYWTPTGATVPLNEWVHVALTRTGSTWQMYVNGVSAGTLNQSQSFWSAGNTLYIGSRPTSGYANEYIGGIRIIKGTAIYSGNFTPPEDVFDVVAGTSLLVCNNKNRLYDESTYSHTVTPNNGASIVPFSRFDYERYDALINGGSAYFDGTGDYLLTTVESFGTADFAVEAWLYPTYLGETGKCWFDTRDAVSSNGMLLYVFPTGELSCYSSGSTILTSSKALKLNTWSHVAFVRNNGTVYWFINGLLSGSASYSSIIAAPGGATIGARYDALANFIGYISNHRVVNGDTVYTSNFTPPTAPLTAITNTSLLLNFTNAGIQDYSQVSDLKLVGNATGSSTQVKNASYSMYFDGTGDAIRTPVLPEFGFGTGDFTLEFWLNYTGGNGYVFFLINSTSTPYIGYGLNTGTKNPWVWNDADVLTTSTPITNDVWQHHAVVRHNGTLTIYLDGTSIGSTTWTVDLGASRGFAIGDNNNGIQFTTGYIEDLRITKGLARYTANFTPPTSELLG